MQLLGDCGSMVCVDGELYRVYVDNDLMINDGKIINRKEWLYNMSFDEKLDYVLEKYDMTLYEFNVLLSVVYHEAAPGSYDDAYRVINTIYNRTISIKWSNYVDAVMHSGGTNMYVQAITPGQFVVYNSSVSGYDTNETCDTEAYKAVLDFLTYGIRSHNYLSFKANFVDIDGMRFTSTGNVYHDEMTSPTEGNDLSYDYDLSYTYLTHDFIMEYVRQMYEINEDTNELTQKTKTLSYN